MMTQSEVNDTLRIMRTERECVMRAENCDRKCCSCDLLLESSDIITAYDKVIEILTIYQSFAP